KSFPDQRGFFRELVRDTDPFFAGRFAQWSHSKMGQNTVKAWHFHHRQIDWWYVGIGVVEAVLVDNRDESPSKGKKLQFKLGERELDAAALQVVVRIPPGVLHGCKVLSDAAHLFYITSETYNPEDEGRLPFNSPAVGHDWGSEADLIVADNDRRTFVPTFTRVERVA
ncbi:MAG: dTDP-4-dehydrorhamnose 3,5-epimerase family protein, partial [Bdellovibrionales bacterium]|nr:dTDP-4-dehydrorhamnose 3,5-epimerase family protein [Bdellovibrionales bacterium]